MPPITQNIHFTQKRNKYDIYINKKIYSTVLSPNSNSKPNTVDQALSDLTWKAAMPDEYDALI